MPIRKQQGVYTAFAQGYGAVYRTTSHPSRADPGLTRMTPMNVRAGWFRHELCSETRAPIICHAHRSPIRRGRVRQSRGGIRRHHQHRRRRNSPTFTRAQANAMPRLRQVQPVVAYAFRMIASPGTRSGPPAASGSTQAPCHYALDDMTVLVAGEAELPNPTRAVGLKRDAKGWFRLPRPRQAVPLRPSNNRAERLHRRPDSQEKANQGKEFFHLSDPPSS